MQIQTDHQGCLILRFQLNLPHDSIIAYSDNDALEGMDCTRIGMVTSGAVAAAFTAQLNGETHIALIM